MKEKDKLREMAINFYHDYYPNSHLDSTVLAFLMAFGKSLYKVIKQRNQTIENLRKQNTLQADKLSKLITQQNKGE